MSRAIFLLRPTRRRGHRSRPRPRFHDSRTRTASLRTRTITISHGYVNEPLIPSIRQRRTRASSCWRSPRPPFKVSGVTGSLITLSFHRVGSFGPTCPSYIYCFVAKFTPFALPSGAVLRVPPPFFQHFSFSFPLSPSARASVTAPRVLARYPLDTILSLHRLMECASLYH